MQVGEHASQNRPRRANAMSGVKQFEAGAAPPPRLAHAEAKRKREEMEEDLEDLIGD